MRHTRTHAAIIAATLAATACGSGTGDHAGTNVATGDDRNPPSAEETTDGDDATDGDTNGQEEDTGGQDDEPGWTLDTTPYGDPADVDADGDARGVWIVTVEAPECGATFDLPDGYAHSDTADPQGQWCTVDIHALNDADQPLSFWGDNSFAMADWDARMFTPDSSATMDNHDDGSVYTERQVGQTFNMTLWFDVPATLDTADLAGVAIENTRARSDDELTVWADDE